VGGYLQKLTPIVSTKEIQESELQTLE